MQLSMTETASMSRTKTTPIPTARSVRTVPVMAGTTIPAGRQTPIFAFPLLREDKMLTSDFMCRVDINETVEAIRNGIKVRFMTYLVPFLAFAKWDGGMDEFNRSYMKTAGANGQAITPFFDTMVAGAYGSIPIHRYLGFHAEPTDVINDAYIRAYNLIYNFRLRNRSELLFQNKRRAETTTSLAPALWNHEQFKYVVPDWDDVAMEGAINLTFTQPRANVRGIALGTVASGGAGSGLTDTVGTGVNYAHRQNVAPHIQQKLVGSNYLPDIWVDLASAGAQLSLANIDLAYKVKWFAEQKAKLEGIGGEALPKKYVIDLLMQGITVPDQAWQQPILLADKTVVAQQNKRWATDGANLATALTNGFADCELSIAIPRCPTGGIVMTVAEILPDQLFERMRDPLLFTTDPDQLPRADRDALDPQKVERMSNSEVDTSQTVNPNGLFGYRPQNWKWQASYTRLGGKYHRVGPSNTFNQDRAQFWVIEKQNPTYDSDFMIAESMNQLPFAQLNVDVGECMAQGAAVIEGNTQFGERLRENDNAFNEVLQVVDQTRITKGV